MSAEAPRNSGTGEPILPQASKSGFSRFLRRLFATPPELQLTQQLKPHVPLNQLLDDIDHGREADKSATATAWLHEQQAKEKALQEAWDKAKSLEASIKDFLTIADPVISEGLSIIARRTWGEDEFTIIKYGTAFHKNGANDGFRIIGAAPITSIDLFDLEAAEPPHLGYLSGAEFNYHAQRVDKFKAPAYDPYAGYYEATLEFRDGKPHSLQFGAGTTLNKEELKMIGQENVLTRALTEYYRHGPEVYVFVGEG